MPRPAALTHASRIIALSSILAGALFVVALLILWAPEVKSQKCENGGISAIILRAGSGEALRTARKVWRCFEVRGLLRSGGC
jgi:hypothetical protein